MVVPSDQVRMSFDFWWALFTDIIKMNDRRGFALPLWPGRQYLPDAEQLEARAWNLGLRPWMSSSNWEEMSGAIRALEVLRGHDRDGRMDADEVMVRLMLPGMLITELHWLRKDDRGRPRTRGDRFEVIFVTRCRRALTAWSAGQYLTPLDAAYLRANDIIDALLPPPERPEHPLLQRILDLYSEMQQAYNERHPTDTT
jgi:hypothetical protein